MKIYIHQNFKDVEKDKTTALRYPKLDVFRAVYTKMKGYKPSLTTINYYKKVAQPLETFLLSEEGKWERYRKDMLEISQQFPDLYFVVIEEGYRYWFKTLVARYCFHNGKVTGGYVKLLYTEFKEEELK